MPEDPSPVKQLSYAVDPEAVEVYDMLEEDVSWRRLVLTDPLSRRDDDPPERQPKELVSIRAEELVSSLGRNRPIEQCEPRPL